LPHGDIQKVDLSKIPDHDLLAAGEPVGPKKATALAS
jgi:hypothetical protein